MLPPSSRYEGMEWVLISHSYVPTTSCPVSAGLYNIVSCIYRTKQCHVSSGLHSATCLLDSTVSCSY